MADKPTETPEPEPDPAEPEADEPVTKRDVGQVVKEFVDARLSDLGIFKGKDPDPEPASEPEKAAPASSHKTQDAIGQEWRADVEKEVERVLAAKAQSQQPAPAAVPAETPPAEKPTRNSSLKWGTTSR